MDYLIDTILSTGNTVNKIKSLLLWILQSLEEDRFFFFFQIFTVSGGGKDKGDRMTCGWEWWCSFMWSS